MRHLLMLLLLLFFSLNSQADECKVDPQRTEFYSQTAAAVQKVLDQICTQDQNRIQLSELKIITAEAISTAKLEINVSLQQYAKQIALWTEDLYREKQSASGTVLSIPNKEISTTDKMIFFNGRQMIGELSLKKFNDCNQALGSCKKRFNNIAYLLNQMHMPYTQHKRQIVEKRLLQLDKNWERYLSDARSQTFMDIWATTWIYEVKQNSEDQFSPPPTTQMFFLHPSIVLENINGVSGDDKLEESLAIELIGVNWWDKKNACFGYACGASLVLTYSEYQGLDNTGVGLMFHIENKYSFGVTERKNAIGKKERGIFVSVDLLKLFEDKKSQVEKWNKHLPEKIVQIVKEE